MLFQQYFATHNQWKNVKHQIKGRKKSKNSEIVEQLIASTWNDNESYLYTFTTRNFKWILSWIINWYKSSNSALVCLKKDCSVQTNNTKTKLKSVKTQCSKPIPCEDCKKKRTLIKITKIIPIGSHSNSWNSNLSFPPDQGICISANVYLLFSAPIKAGELHSEKG